MEGPGVVGKELEGIQYTKALVQSDIGRSVVRDDSAVVSRQSIEL